MWRAHNLLFLRGRLVFVLWLCAAAVQGAPSAELSVDQFEIYPLYLTERLPKDGKPVDKNPPFLFCAPDNASSLGTLFYFRLSQDETFASGVITNTPHRWSFYSPYTPLAQGTWYWQYAYQPTGTVGAALSWSDRFSFTIDSNAWRQVAPPVSVLQAGLVSNGFPRTMCKGAGQMGNLWPQDEALRTSLSNAALAILSQPVSRTLCDEAIRCYVLMPTAANRSYLTNTFAALNSYYTSQPYSYDAEIVYRITEAQYYDVMQPSLSAAERNTLRASGRGALTAWVQGFINRQERLMLDEHRWQLEMKPMLFEALAFYDPSDAESAEDLEYVYDLWNFKGPIGGRYDGGWSAGNGYIATHLQTTLFYPLLFGRHTGADYFGSPWYMNLGKYFSYMAPPGYPGGASGDRDEFYGNSFYDISKFMRVIRPGNPYDHRVWALGASSTRDFAGDEFMTGVEWFLLPDLRSQPLPDVTAPVVALDKGAWFPDTGDVALYSQPDDLSNTVRVITRATPWGMVGHGHACNNAFNITYGGQKVFYRTGYYTGAGDPFSVENYRHTRAHNSILPYGTVTQSMDTEGYGWMPRFVAGKHLSYSLGDASHAYSGSFARSVCNPTISGRSLTIADGYADPGVTRFRRHLALLETGTVVVYDELEAQTAIPWTFRLNSPGPMVKVGSNGVATSCSNGFAVAELYCDTPVTVGVTDLFDSGPVSAYAFLTTVWGRRDWLSGANQWHANFTPTNALQKTRFLTLVHRVQNGEPLVQSVQSLSSSGRQVISSGGWHVEAELDAGKPSFLKIWDNAGTAMLVSGQATTNVQLGAGTYTAQQPGSTMLMELGQPVQEVVDTLPNAVRYGNLY